MLGQGYDVAAQAAFGDTLLGIIGFDFAAGRVDRSTHAVALFAGTLAVTLPLAAFIRVTVEDPFIRWGRTLAGMLEPRRKQEARIAEV